MEDEEQEEVQLSNIFKKKTVQEEQVKEVVVAKKSVEAPPIPEIPLP